jgi:predicted dehydrogenase
VATLKAGIVGAGGMGTEQPRAWQNNAPRGEPVAVAAPSAPRAGQIAERSTAGPATTTTSTPS